MSDAFIGEIRFFGFDYPPENWLPCDGRLYKISEYTALYAVIADIYGDGPGDHFAVPNLLGYAACGESIGEALGTRTGEDTITLSVSQMPLHTHQMVRPGKPKAFIDKSSAPSSQVAPASLAESTDTPIKALAPPSGARDALSPYAVDAVGGGKAHNNMQPYLPLFPAICWNGLFPSRP